MNTFRLLLMVALASAVSPLLRAAVNVTNNSSCCNLVAVVKQYSYYNDVLQSYCPSWGTTIYCGETLSISDYTEQYPGVEVEVVYQLQYTIQVSTSCPPQHTLSSTTHFGAPGPLTRTRLGVGERTYVTISPIPLGGATWSSTAGPNSLTSHQAGSVTFWAPDTPGNFTVTATVGGANYTREFEVVAPSHLYLERVDNYGFFHLQGTPSAGMLAHVYVMPNDVNFSAIEVCEEQCPPSTLNGYFAQAANPTHIQGSWVPLNTHVANKGTYNPGWLDIAAFWGEASWPHQNGQWLWQIPLSYKMKNGSNVYPFVNNAKVNQAGTTYPDGRLTVSKNSNILYTAYLTDDTGNWTPWNPPSL